MLHWPRAYAVPPRLSFAKLKPIYMKQNNKVSDLFGVICVAAIFAGCVENLDGSLSLWTVACLAVALLTGWISKKTEEK